MQKTKFARVPRHKNVTSMSDEEFSTFLDKCWQKGLTTEEIDAIIEADGETICPILDIVK